MKNISRGLLAAALLLIATSAHAMRPTGSHVGKIGVKTLAANNEVYYTPTADTDAARGVALQNAFAAAPASATITIGPGDYFLTAELDVNTGQTIILQSARIYHTDETLDIFVANLAINASIEGNGTLQGAGLAAGTSTDEVGIRVTGTNVYNFAVRGIRFVGFRWAGISLESSTDIYRNPKISDCIFEGNNYGVNILKATEYVRLENNQFDNNYTGLYSNAGNTVTVNNMFNANSIGFHLNGVGNNNNGHGLAAGNTFNHNSSYGVYIDSITLGHVFVGNTFYGSSGMTAAVYINATYGLQFQACQFGLPNTILLAGDIDGYNYMVTPYFIGGNPTVTCTATGDVGCDSLRIMEPFVEGAAFSTLADAILPEHGGTGTTTRPSHGQIPVANYSGDYSYSTNYTRTMTGALVQTGQTTFTNTVTPTTINTGVHDNRGLVIRGAKDTESPYLEPNDASISGGLELWLRAETIADSDGASVTTWYDQSGNGRDATQGTAANQPIYKLGILNGRPVVRFDQNNWLTTASFSGNQPYNVFVVAIQHDDANQVFFDWNGHLLYGGPGATRIFAATTNLAFSVTATNWNLYDLVANGVSSAVSINGGADTTGDAGAANPNGTFTIGNYHTPGTYEFDGDIAEILVYTGGLTDPQREGLRRYLAGKYGLTVTAGSSTALTEQTGDMLQIQDSMGASITGFLADGSYVPASCTLTTRPTFSNGQYAKRYVRDACGGNGCELMGHGTAGATVWVDMAGNIIP